MADWSRTMFSEKRLEDVLEGESYLGRKIIHRDSPIDKGVYLGAGEREAIVVDSDKYPAIRKLYEKAKEKALVGLAEKDIVKCMVLRAVYETVKETMTACDEKAVDAIVRLARCGKDGKIALDLFIENQVGVCRHMALACGALLELFRKDGFVSGNISIDRNTDKGGHAWCRYTNSGGEVYILDVAQNYVGRMEKAVNWDYRRPDEQ
ncbi:MAG: hypothetical protein KJ955_07765 [Nanoarchaeota archaeon]|nr:hypothetical protein [Nanoarchaeota archaeon]